LNTTVKILDQLQLYIISIPLPPIITLFPYTTLFRSSLHTKRRNLSTIPPTPFPFFVHACKIWLSSDYAHPPLLDRLHPRPQPSRSEEHTSELQSRGHLVCRLLLEKKKTYNYSLDNPD